MQRLFLGLVLVVPLLCLGMQAHAQSNGSESYKKGVELSKAGKGMFEEGAGRKARHP